MKIKQLLLLVVLATLISCGKSAITNTKIKSAEDSLSYALGVNIQTSFAAQDSSIVFNPAVIAKAMIETINGKAFMDENQSREFIYAYMSKKEAEKYKDIKLQGAEFLEKNKGNEGVIVTPSGLQYKVLTMGNGDKPTETDIVKVHYTGTLIDGTKFDSSVERGEPAQFQVNGVIKGWVEGLQLMPVGSKFMFYVPQDLAYGENGAGDVIKPFTTLIFEVELLSIEK